MRFSNGKKVLVSGASFAGISSAWWMHQLGYDVTVVEIAPGIRRGGTAVNIRGTTIDIVKRMGIFEKIEASRLSLRQWDFKNADDRTERRIVVRAANEPPPADDYEIERDVLMGILVDAVKDRCTIVFGDSVVGISETDRVAVAFKNGESRLFDLVLGCDGAHSTVRRLCFGDDSAYLHSLQQYFSITIVDKLLIPPDTAELFNVPGKAVMLNAYKNKTDIVLAFFAEKKIAYDRRDEMQQRGIIAEQFHGVGWRTAQLLDEVAASRSFYFDELCQIRMPSWSRGRVVLVGDAAYCPSPAAGMGGSLAMDGAFALAEALRSAPGDHVSAFHDYDARFRPFIDQIQADAVRFGLESLVPRTEEAIRQRNARTGAGF